MTDIEYVMACVECGVNRAWPDFLCSDCVPAGMSGQYNVTLVHDLFTITTLVTAESKEEAIKVAEQFFTQDQGLPEWVADRANDAQVELQAVLA